MRKLRHRKDLSELLDPRLVKIISDVAVAQQVRDLGFCGESLHSASKGHAVINCLALVREVKLHLSELAALFEDKVLRACFNESLRVLEHRLSNLLVVLKAFFGQSDGHLEI